MLDEGASLVGGEDAPMAGLAKQVLATLRASWSVGSAPLFRHSRSNQSAAKRVVEASLGTFRNDAMPVGTRIALIYLVLTGIAVGAWAYGFPAEFYRSFPGLGRSWVSMDGPYNQHLIRDAGAAVFNGLHLAYHATHLGMFGMADRALNALALGSAVVASVWLLMPQARVRP